MKFEVKGLLGLLLKDQASKDYSIWTLGTSVTKNMDSVI